MISTTHKDDIFKRPLYKLSAYVYKYGKKPSANDVLGTGKDFELLESDFFHSGNVIRAESGAFPCGNAVSKTCKLTINSSTRYKAEDFAGAHLVLRTTAYLEGKSWTVTGDYYFVQTVTVESGKIALECADLMVLADKPYKYDVEFKTSAGYSTTTIENVLASVCKQMGVSYNKDTTPNSAGVVNFSNVRLASTIQFEEHCRLERSNYTCRQMLEFIAMATLSNIIVEDGGLGVKTNPLYYANSDGSGAVFYGHELSDYWISFAEEAEQIKITSIQAIQETNPFTGNEIEPITHRYPETAGKYILDVSENPFFQDGNGIQSLYTFLSVPIFRKFRATYMGYPLVEYGDYIQATHKGGVAKSFITEYEWNVSGGLTIGCNIESAADNSSTYAGGAGSAVTSNQEVLDSITEEKVEKWDAASATTEELADYIVQQGVTGKWSWEKWHSGKKVCRAVFETDVLDVNQAWGSIYYNTWMNMSENKAARRYPFDFTEPPTVIASPAQYNTADFFLITDVGNNAGTELTHAPAYAIARPTSTRVTNPRIAYYIEGK